MDCGHVATDAVTDWRQFFAPLRVQVKLLAGIAFGAGTGAASTGVGPVAEAPVRGNFTRRCALGLC